MRYVIQFLIPALVVIVVALALTRSRKRATQPDEGPISIGTLITLVLIGAALSVALVFAFQSGA